jgi:hypothetical protein
MKVERVMSQNGNYLLEMHPAKWGKVGDHFVKSRKSKGIVYSVAKDGLLTYLWEANDVYNRHYDLHVNSHWYDNLEHFITNDGKKIVSVVTRKKLNRKTHGNINNITDTFIKLIDKSGVLLAVGNDKLQGQIWYGGRLMLLKSYNMNESDNLHFTSYGLPDKTKPSSAWPDKEWVLDTKTAQLKKLK